MPSDLSNTVSRGPEPSNSPAVPELDLHRPPSFEGVAIADPGSVRAASGGRIGAAGDLVLMIDADVPTVLAAIGAPDAAELAGVVIRADAIPADVLKADVLGSAVSAAGRSNQVPCYRLPAETTWSEAHRALTAVLAERSADLGPDDDLATLAQTIATLTGGLVSIEDTSARVLAYSRSSDEVDDLRRLSILGRSGPADYLDLLRQWGIYDRLAASEEVVEIAEHPETGVRRRLAVGVFAGQRQLGTIWVQQGRQEFGPHAKQALLGAARLTAGHLVARQSRSRTARSSSGSGIDAAALLAGRPARSAGLDRRTAERSCVVVAFDVTDRASNQDDRTGRHRTGRHRRRAVEPSTGLPTGCCSNR